MWMPHSHETILFVLSSFSALCDSQSGNQLTVLLRLRFSHAELLETGGLYADMWHQQQTSADDDAHVAHDVAAKPDVTDMSDTAEASAKS